MKEGGVLIGVMGRFMFGLRRLWMKPTEYWMGPVLYVGKFPVRVDKKVCPKGCIPVEDERPEP